MSTEENKQLARQAFEELWNQGKLETIDELYAADQVSHGLGLELPSGTDGLNQFISTY